ncbi:MAG: nucleotidyltransferase domain-containing protein [Caldimicrobium sp.]
MKEKIIKKIIEEIFEEKKVKIKKIILFGSRARKDYRKGSDWDLLIVTEYNLQRDQKLQLTHLVRKRLAKELIPSDVLIKSEEEVEERKHIIGSVIKTAINEGVVL